MNGSASFIPALWYGSPNYNVINISSLPIALSTLKVSSLTANYIDAKKIYVDNLSTVLADIVNLRAVDITATDKISTNKFTADTASISSLTVSSLGSAANLEFSSITVSSLFSLVVSTPFLAVSTINLSQPSLSAGGVTVDLGLGGLIGGFLGSAGSQVMNTLLSGAALATGIAGLTTTRTTSTIASNVYETVNGSTQLQISSIGSQISTFFRTVSSISANSVPGREIFVSSIIDPGTLCVRSVSDPLYLASSNLTGSTIQSFGQWVVIPKPSILPYLMIDYITQPALTLSTGVLFASSLNVPYTTPPVFSTLGALNQTMNMYNTTESLYDYISTAYIYPQTLTLGATTPTTPTVLNPPFLNGGLYNFAGGSNQYINMTGFTFNTCVFDINTNGITGKCYLSTFGGNAPGVPPPTLYAIPPNSTMRLNYNFNTNPFYNTLTTAPLPLSTIVSSITANKTTLQQFSTGTVLNVSTATGRGAFSLNALPLIIGSNTQTTTGADVEIDGTVNIFGNLYVTGARPGGNGVIAVAQVGAGGTNIQFGGANIRMDTSFGNRSGGFIFSGFQSSAPESSTIMLNPSFNTVAQSAISSLVWASNGLNTTSLTISDSIVNIPRGGYSYFSTLNVGVGNFSTINAQQIEISTITFDNNIVVSSLTANTSLNSLGTLSVSGNANIPSISSINLLGGNAFMSNSLTIGVPPTADNVNLVLYPSTMNFYGASNGTVANIDFRSLSDLDGILQLQVSSATLLPVGFQLDLLQQTLYSYAASNNFSGVANFSNIVNVGGVSPYTSLPLTLWGLNSKIVGLTTNLVPRGVTLSAPISSGSLLKVDVPFDWYKANLIRCKLYGDIDSANPPITKYNSQVLYSGAPSSPELDFFVTKLGVQTFDGINTYPIDSSNIFFSLPNLIYFPTNGGTAFYPSRSATVNPNWPVVFDIKPTEDLNVVGDFFIWMTASGGAGQIVDFSLFNFTYELEWIV